MNKLYIDIETLPGDNKPNLEEIKVPANYKDPEKIKAYQEENLEIEYRKQALNSMQGQIFCIGYAIDDEKPVIFAPTTGSGLLEHLIEIITDLNYPEIIGHNISFDLAFIFHSCLKQGLKFPAIYLQPKCNLIIDTMKLWNPWEYKAYYKLTDIAKFLGIESKDEIDGSKVYDLYLAGEYEKIYSHCISDVQLTRTIDKVLRGF